MAGQPDPDSSDTAGWLLVALMAAACLLACHGLGFVVEPLAAVPAGVGLAVLVGTMLFARARGRTRLDLGATAFLQMTLFTLLGVVLAYALAARGGALWDDRLAAADARLGLDWPAIRRVADRLPAALWVGAIAYHGLVAQMIVCIVALSAAGRAGELRRAVVAAILSGAVTIAISGAVPAMGNLVDPASYRHLWPSVAWQERALIAGLRDGSGRVLDLTRLMGIVSFPSYHATLAVILAWAQRNLPVLRVASPACAGVTILATPLFGGHYGVDVLAGLGLAVAAIAVAPWLATRRTWSPALSPPLSRRSAPPAGPTGARHSLAAPASARDAGRPSGYEALVGTDGGVGRRLPIALGGRSACFRSHGNGRIPYAPDPACPARGPADRASP